MQSGFQMITVRSLATLALLVGLTGNGMAAGPVTFKVAVNVTGLSGVVFMGLRVSCHVAHVANPTAPAISPAQQTVIGSGQTDLPLAGSGFSGTATIALAPVAGADISQANYYSCDLKLTKMPFGQTVVPGPQASEAGARPQPATPFVPEIHGDFPPITTVPLTQILH